MKEKFRVLIRKFEPFEKSAALFWEQFSRDTDTGLDLEMVSSDLPELHEAIMSKEFDVAQVCTDWLAEAHDSGCLTALDSFIKAEPPKDFPSGWVEPLLGLQHFDDGVYGIPFHDGPECFIFRKDLFDSEKEAAVFKAQTGMPLCIPKTWDEFEKAAVFFNRPEKGLYGTLFALYPDGHNNIFDFALQLWSRGGSLIGPEGEVRLHTAEAVGAMRYYRRLINQPFIHPESRKMDSIASCLAFSRGEAAMMVNWFGFATMCETTEESKVKGKVDVGPVPHAEGQRDPVSLNVYYTWSISSKSRNPKLAYDFIRHCVLPESDARLTLEGGVGC
jgi:multiple sugar transport system substrate-binding protein